MDHWQARLRGPRQMAREPAWRLNAHRSFLMTDGINRKTGSQGAIYGQMTRPAKSVLIGECRYHASKDVKERVLKLRCNNTLFTNYPAIACAQLESQSGFAQPSACPLGRRHFEHEAEADVDNFRVAIARFYTDCSWD